jgi:hypothetical protein
MALPDVKTQLREHLLSSTIIANLAMLIRNDLPISGPAGSALYCTHLSRYFPLSPNTVHLKILDNDASARFPPYGISEIL